MYVRSAEKFLKLLALEKSIVTINIIESAKCVEKCFRYLYLKSTQINKHVLTDVGPNLSKFIKNLSILI